MYSISKTPNRKTVTRKVPPIIFPSGEFPPEKLHPEIPTQNIPIKVFKYFVFSLLSPLSLILVKILLLKRME